MQSLSVLPDLVGLVGLLPLADEPPEAEDVKAGWLAFAIFIALIVAVAFLGRSLVKQLRKAQAAEDAGLYDPSDRRAAPRPTVQTSDPADPADPDQPPAD
jgi:hypothetical protein